MKLPFLLLIAAGAANAQTLVVLNKSDANVSLIDAASGSTLAKIPVGRGPHEVALSSDGRVAYVANFGRYSRPASDTMRTMPGRSISVLDLERRDTKALQDFAAYSGIHGVATSRDGTLLWFTSEAPNMVVELDLKTNAVRHAWPTGGQRTHLVLPSPDETRLYITSTISGSLAIVDRATGKTTQIPIGPGAEGLTISPDGKELWVARRDDSKISIVSTATNTVIDSLSAGGGGPQRVRFTPDGLQVWSSNAQSNTVTIFDARSRKLIGSVSVGAGPAGSVFSADGKTAFIALSGADQIAVIDVASHKVLRNITTGAEPDGIAWRAPR